VILFHLFGGKVLRFSELERAIAGISQKMLIQQLRQMERDGIVRRIVHHQVPPKVEYALTSGASPLPGARCAIEMGGAARDEVAAAWFCHPPVTQTLKIVTTPRTNDVLRRSRPAEEASPNERLFRVLAAAALTLPLLVSCGVLPARSQSSR